MKKISILSEFGNICGVFSGDYSNKDNVILLIHGFNSHKLGKSLVPVNEALVNSGVLTFRIDLYAHGDSSGNFEELTVTKSIQSVVDSIKYLKSLGFKKIGLIGSSFGGLSGIFATEKFNDLSFLILRSAVSINQGEIICNSFKIDLADWKNKGFAEFESQGINKLNYTFYEDAQKYNAYNIASKIKIPTLIIHGKEDSIVPVEQSIELSKRIKHSRLFLVENANHSFNEEQNNLLISEVNKFLKQIHFLQK
ncbi:prolyl oligopeptidase family serine peptidase [Candidatus Pacearchaeota archaeon]|nr:prolyl oligopeptidase family serine peptidase [Candidatus Pacearchaeota archaeon]